MYITRGYPLYPTPIFNYRQLKGAERLHQSREDCSHAWGVTSGDLFWEIQTPEIGESLNHHCLLIQFPIVLMVQSLYVWWFTGNLSGCHEKSPCSVDVDLLSTAMFNCQRVDPDWKLLNGSVWKMRNPYIHPLVIFVMFPFKWLFGRYTRIPHVQTHPFEASNVFFGIRVDKDG